MNKARINILSTSILLAGIALIAGLQSGCEQDTGSTLLPEKITIAGAGQPVGGTVYVASAKGYFRNEGLDITLEPYTSGRDALKAVAAGKATLAASAETPIMHAAMRGEKISIIATIGTTEKNMAVIGRKDRGITMPGDLKGKRIGASLGTNGEFFMDSFLMTHRISRDNIEVVDLNPEDIPGALVAGDVDAASTWNPHLIRLQQALGDTGVTFYDEAIYTWTWNLAATQDFVHEHPDHIQKVLRALIKAEKFMRENPEESRGIIADRTNMDKALLGELWDNYSFTVTLEQSLLIALEDQARWAIRNRRSDATEIPNFFDFIYLDGLAAVRPEAVTVIR